MAASIVLPMGGAMAGPISPGYKERLSAGTTPFTYRWRARYDGSVENWMHWPNFVWPADYAGGLITVRFWYAMASATTGAVIPEFKLAASAGSTVITSKAYAAVKKSAAITVPGVTNTLAEKTFTLTQAEADGVVAGALVDVAFGRIPTDAGDTATGFLDLYGLKLEPA